MAKLLQSMRGQLLIAVLLFLSVTVLADRFTRSITLDLTEDRLYTLSPGTLEVLRELKEPVQLDLYISKTLVTPYPGLLAWSKRVEDLLRAMQRAVPSAIDLTVIDPEPFSEAEDEAVAAGLQGISLGDGSTLYLGLSATNLVDGSASIPFFSEDRESLLEYDLIKLIIGLSDVARPRLGLLTGLPMQFGAGGPQAMLQGQSNPFAIYNQLQEFFDVRSLTADFDTLADLDIVMLVHPEELGDDQLYLLEQYALGGGRLAVFVDPHAESLDPRATLPVASTFKLLDGWGISIPTTEIVGDRDQAQRVQLGQGGPDDVKDYLFWLALQDDFINNSDIATAEVDQINMASAGVIRLAPESSLAETALLTTSENAMLFNAARAVGVPDPDSLIRDLEPSGVRETLIGRYTGAVTTQFADRAEAEGGLKEGSVTLLVGADTDLFYDRFWVQIQNLFGSRVAIPIAGNGGLVLNLLDHLVGSEALLSLRTRGVAARPFTVVNDLRRAAENRYLAEEERLQNELTATEARLDQLEQARTDANQLYSAEQEAEIDRFRESLIETRRALRDVKGNLRRDIDQLGTWLAFINTGLIPLFVLIFGLFLPRVLRRRRSDLTP